MAVIAPSLFTSSKLTNPRWSSCVSPKLKSSIQMACSHVYTTMLVILRTRYTHLKEKRNRGVTCTHCHGTFPFPFNGGRRKPGYVEGPLEPPVTLGSMPSAPFRNQLQTRSLGWFQGSKKTLPSLPPRPVLVSLVCNLSRELCELQDP